MTFSDTEGNLSFFLVFLLNGNFYDLIHRLCRYDKGHILALIVNKFFSYRHSETVNCNKLQLIIGNFKFNSGIYHLCVRNCNGKYRLFYHFFKHHLIKIDCKSALNCRKLGIFVSGNSHYLIFNIAASDNSKISFVGIKGYCLIRNFTEDFTKNFCIDYNCAFFLYLCIDIRIYTYLKIVTCQRKSVDRCLNKYALCSGN